MTQVIAVRGVGVVSALGVGAGTALSRIAADPSAHGFSPAASGPAYAAPFDPARDLPRGIGRRLGRQPAMALAAVLEAVADAALSPEEVADAAVVLGTAHGPVAETLAFLNGAFRDGARYASPALFAGSLHNAMSGAVGRELGARGPAFVVCNGETSFETALVSAIALLRSGRVRFAVAGCSEAYDATSLRVLAEAGYCAAQREVIDPRMLRTTRGIVPGEGGAALVLEATDGAGGGVRIADAALGAEAVAQCVGSAGAVREIISLANGDVRSAAQHRAAIAASGAGDVPLSHPAARFGAFAALSAVTIALEAARRRAAGAGELAAAVTVNVPVGAPPAAVVISGCGRG